MIVKPKQNWTFLLFVLLLIVLFSFQTQAKIKTFQQSQNITSNSSQNIIQNTSEQNSSQNFSQNSSQEINPPTLKIIIQQHLLQKYKDQILPQLEDDIEKRLQALQIPEFNSSKKELFFHASIGINEIQIESFTFDPASVYVEFLNNQSGVSNGIALSINDFEIAMKGSCSYTLGFIHSSGTITASINNASLHTFIEIGVENHDIEVNVVDIEIVLNNFNIDVEGSFFLKITKWFVELFQGSFKKQIQQSIIDDKSIINEEIKKILKIPDIVNFYNQKIGLSFELINIQFSSDYFELDVSAYFFNSEKPQTRPSLKNDSLLNLMNNNNLTIFTDNTTFSNSSENNLMSTVLFSQYFIQSFLYALQDSNSLFFMFEENLNKFNIYLASNNSNATIYIQSLKMPQIKITNENFLISIKSQIYLYIGDQLFLNCSISAYGILDHNTTTQQLQIEQLQVKKVNLYNTSWDFLNEESIKFITEFAVDKQIDALNQKLNYIPINNRYIPFKAIQPTIFTRDGYCELNIYSEDVVKNGQKYSKRQKKLLQSSVNKRIAKEFKKLKQLEEL